MTRDVDAVGSGPDPDPLRAGGCDAGAVSGVEPSAAERPPLRRRPAGRLVAGVCTGVAEHLGVNVTVVRMVFALLAVNGIGVVGYLALWVLVDESPDPDGHDARPGADTRLRRPRDVVRAVVRDRAGDPPRRRRTLAAYLLAGGVTGSVLGATGIGLGRRSVLPVAIAVLGALLIWSRTPATQRERWTRDARHYGSRIGRRGPLLVALGGAGLVIVGVTSFLAANNALRQARDGALAIVATLVGVALVAGPWLFRLVREVTEERRARIREHERAEVAAHVHDSVLQTLALIQSHSADADAVRRLARHQERELRSWLYEQPPDAAPAGFAAALRAAAAEVEDAHGVSIEVVVVGDARLDEELAAMVAAAKAGMVNAAKSSGAPSVSVFAEAGDSGVEVFVRDRGTGFDLDRVPADRHGIRESIVGRMARHGGHATIRSGPTGTEIALSIGRAAPA
jgi:signal transduction histidine kinase/phage shock protein PspC (stress-responsive transcriptional regulator)